MAPASLQVSGEHLAIVLSRRTRRGTCTCSGKHQLPPNKVCRSARILKNSSTFSIEIEAPERMQNCAAGSRGSHGRHEAGAALLLPLSWQP